MSQHRYVPSFTPCPVCLVQVYVASHVHLLRQGHFTEELRTGGSLTSDGGYSGYSPALGPCIAGLC